MKLLPHIFCFDQEIVDARRYLRRVGDLEIATHVTTWRCRECGREETRRTASHWEWKGGSVQEAE